MQTCGENQKKKPQNPKKKKKKVGMTAKGNKILKIYNTQNTGVDRTDIFKMGKTSQEF